MGPDRNDRIDTVPRETVDVSDHLAFEADALAHHPEHMTSALRLIVVATRL
jgi:pterin-4a-carbinolamine dehydratase